MRAFEPGDVGWCHNCGTLQLFEAAVWLTMPIMGAKSEVVPCCPVCCEWWEFGVFPQSNVYIGCAERQHVTFWDTDGCDDCNFGPEL